MALVNFEHLNTLAESAGGSWLLGVGFVLVFGVLNAFGVSAFGRAEVVLTFGMWTTLMVFGVLGLLAAPAVELDGPFGVSMVGTDRSRCSRWWAWRCSCSWAASSSRPWHQSCAVRPG